MHQGSFEMFVAMSWNAVGTWHGDRLLLLSRCGFSMESPLHAPTGAALV